MPQHRGKRSRVPSAPSPDSLGFSSLTQRDTRCIIDEEPADANSQIRLAALSFFSRTKYKILFIKIRQINFIKIVSFSDLYTHMLKSNSLRYK